MGRVGRFRPILAGATLRDRMLACGGALAALCVTALLGAIVVGHTAALPYLVAPIGASAVLVFAVPASPLAQPWSVVGGNVLSTLVGLGVLALVDDPFPTRTGRGGPTPRSAAAASVPRTCTARWTRSARRSTSAEDLGLLLREVETQALVRRHGEPTAGDVMSREVVRVEVHDTPATARALLLAQDVRTLPVLAADGTVVGTVGLRELVRPGACVGELASPPLTAPADLPALALSRALTDGRARAAVIVDAAGRLRGMVTQTDLIVALCRALTDPV